MATITGTIDGITLLSRSVRGDMKTFLVNCQFPTFTGSADTVTLSAVGAAIATHQKNGKTIVLDHAAAAGPGLSSASVDTYASAVTVSSDDVNFDLVTSTGADLNSDLTSGVQLAVSCRES